MKKDRKTTPLIAAHAANKNNHKPVSPVKEAKAATRISNVPKQATAKTKSLTLDRISEGILALDHKLNYSYLNERAGELLGCKPEDLIGKNSANLDGDKPPFLDACQRAFETQTTAYFNGYFTLTDTWLEGRAFPSEEGVSVLFTDEISSKEGETENRRREQRYRILFDTMQEGFLLAEVINDQDDQPVDYRFLEANASMERFLGKSREELVNHTASELFAFEDRTMKILKRAGQVALGDAPFSVEEYVHAANRWYRLHVFSPKRGQFANLISDITESKRVELALEKSEKKFSKAFHLNPSAMAIMSSKEGRILDVNQRLLSLFGLSREELLGHTVEELGITANPEQGETLSRLWHEPGGIRDHELTIRTQDSEIHNLLISIEPIEFEGTAHTLISALDITERKQAQEKILDVSKFPGENPNPVMRFTRDGKLLYANNAAAPLLAYWNRQHGREIPLELEEHLSSFIHSDSNLEIELAGDGQIFSCLLVPIRDSGYVNLYFRDITERKQAEESLRALINQTSAGITRADMEGRLTFVNQAFCAMLGYSEPELIGKSIWEISHPDDVAKNQRLFERMRIEGQPYQMEKRLIRKNGSTLWVTVSTSPLRDASGKTYSSVTMLADITRRKRAEESLLETARQTLYLSSVSDTIRQLSDPFQIEIEATHALGVYLKASRVAYMEIDSAETVQIRYNYSDGVENNIGEFQLSDCIPAELLPKFRSGRSVVVTDTQNDFRFNETQRLGHQAAAVHSQIVVPLLKDDQLIAALCVQQSQSRTWNNDEINVVEQTAERMQAAIDRSITEEKLRARVEEIEALLEVSPVGIFVSYDPDCARITANLAGYQLLEMPGQAGANVSKSAPADERPAYRVFRDGRELASEEMPMQTAARLGMEIEAETLELLFENGSRKFVYTFAKPLFDEQGRPRGSVAAMLDITERKRMEENLQAGEEKYRRIVQTANEGIWEIDKDTRTVFVNRHMAEMLGYTVEEMIGRSVFEFVLPEDRLEGEHRLERAKHGGSARAAEFRYRCKDNSVLWVVASNTPTLDDQGNFAGAFAMMSDITDRKQYEQSLIEYARRQTALYTLTDQLNSANSLDDVFDSALDAILSALQCDRASILLFDETKRMRFVAWRGLSEEYRKTTDGHSPWKYGEENPMPIFFNNIATAELSDSLKTVIAGEGIGSLGFIPLVFQGRLIGKFMVYFNTPHVFSESESSLGQTIARQLASAVDRKRNEEKLRQSEERFSRFMQYLPGLAWIKDQQRRYVFANASAQKAFNVTQADLYGKTDQEIFPSDSADQFKLNDEQAITEGGVQVIETLPQPDGVLHYSLVTKFPIPGLDGDTVLIGGTAFDITERVHMEDALRQAREHAEKTADRMSRLQEVTASLAAVTVPAHLVELVLEQGTRATGAAAGLLTEVINGGKDVKTIAALGYPPAAIRTDPAPLSAPTPMSDCIRNRQAIWIESHDEFALQYPALAEFRRGFGNEATVALPLLVGDRVLGGLAFSFREKHEFLLEERGFLLAVAAQCAQGLERARAEVVLHESEERYRAIVNQATAGIVRKDALGKLLFVNDAFCTMLGYSREELTTKTMWQITHEQDVQENQRLFNRLMVEGLSFQLEKRLIRRDGSILWVTVSVSPVLDTAGRAQSAVSVYADITERKHVEEQLHKLNVELEERVHKRTAELQAANEFLRESEEKLRTLFEILPVGISFLNHNAQIIEMNSALAQILGLSKQELLQGSARSRKYIRSNGSLMPLTEFASIRALTEQKTIYNVETGITKENGETIWTSINAAPVKVADVEAVVVTVDITERKNAEAALQKSRERLRVLSRRLVEVQEDERRAIARELHDRVGQNLAALNLNLNILRSQLSDDALIKVGTRLSDSVQLVNDILMITRSVMADLRSNVLDDYGLESALREYADQYTQRFGIRVIPDKTATPIPRLDPNIEMTLLRIAQEALTNVARHAQASQVTITLSVESDTVHMTIQDNGIGILSWQKANQLGSHGLRIIRERTEAFGGSMQIESAYKKGTTIEVKIPIENGSQPKTPREKRS